MLSRTSRCPGLRRLSSPPHGPVCASPSPPHPDPCALLVLPVPVGRSLVRLTPCQGGLQRPSFRTPEPGGRQDGLGFEEREEGGGRTAMWSFWCLLAWFPALPAATPGSVNAWRRLSLGPSLGPAQCLPLDHCSPHLRVPSPAATMLFHLRVGHPW